LSDSGSSATRLTGSPAVLVPELVGIVRIVGVFRRRLAGPTATLAPVGPRGGRLVGVGGARWRGRGVTAARVCATVAGAVPTLVVPRLVRLVVALPGV